MKKIVLAGLAVAAVAATSFAADVKISGSYDLRGYAFDNTNFKANEDDGADARFSEQRVRVQAVMKASDAISVTLRSDLSEGVVGTGQTEANWGTADKGGKAFRLDRAFLTMALPGQMGKLIMGNVGYNFERTGLLLNLHRNDAILYSNDMGMVSVEAGYVKAGETTSNGITEEKDGSGDNDYYLAKATFKPMDGLSIAPYVVYNSDKNNGAKTTAPNFGKTERTAFGVDAGFKAGMFGVDGTIYMIDGEQTVPNGTTTDLEGLVFNMMANVKPVSGLTIGGGYTYRQGDDNPNDNSVENLVSFVDGDGTNDPMGGFIFWNDYTWGSTLLYGTDGKNVSVPSSTGFNGANAFKLYADYAINKFGMGAHFIYAEEAEGVADKELTEFGVYGSYKVYDNAKLTLQLATAGLDESNVPHDDATFAGLALNVKF